MTTTNHDMVEEIAANLDWAREQVVRHLGEAQTVDPDDLVTELAAAPASADQLMDALTELVALGREAAELRALLEGMGF